jgi:hypothetical protein
MPHLIVFESAGFEVSADTPTPINPIADAVADTLLGRNERASRPATFGWTGTPDTAMQRNGMNTVPADRAAPAFSSPRTEPGAAAHRLL